MNQKKVGTAYILFFVSIFGIAGLHRFYLGKIGTGVLYLFTWGFFGFGLIYDLFTLPNQVKMANLLNQPMMNQSQHQNVIVNVTAPVAQTSQPDSVDYNK